MTSARLPRSLRVLLRVGALLHGRSFHHRTVADARRRVRRIVPWSRRRAVASVVDRDIPGPEGDVPIRVYTPKGPGPHPALVFFHGGGFVIGDLEVVDKLCRLLCRGGRCVVVSVAYRLAPEHPFPAGADDCLAATRWVAKNADALAVDSARLAVGGDSAGGNLATVTALRCRDEGGPSLRGQLLLYPVTDHPTPEKPSYDAFAEGYGLERADMLWFWGHYLKDIQLADDPRASPLRAPDLTRLPRALVIIAAFDVLRDEGEQYAERLAVAGVGVTISRYETIHGFLQLHGLHPTCARAVAEACAWLRATLGAERA